MVQILSLKHNATQLKTVFDVLKDLITDANLIFKKDGLHIRTTDPEKVTALSVHLDKLATYDFTNENEEPIYIGVNMQHMYKLLRSVSQDHIAVIEIDSDTINVMKLVIYSPSRGIVSTTSLYTLMLPKEEIVLPELQFAGVARIPTTDFIRTVKELSHGSKRLTISATMDDPTYLTMASKADVYACTTSISICPSENGLSWAYLTPPGIHGCYLSRYIEKMGKSQLAKTMEISITKTGILLLSYADMPLGRLGMIMSPLTDD